MKVNQRKEHIWEKAGESRGESGYREKRPGFQENRDMDDAVLSEMHSIVSMNFFRLVPHDIRISLANFSQRTTDNNASF